MYIKLNFNKINSFTIYEASCGAGAQCDCRRDWLRFPLEEIILLNSSFHYFSERGVELRHQYAMPLEFGGNWGNECVITRFPLPTLMCAEYIF